MAPLKDEARRDLTGIHPSAGLPALLKRVRQTPDLGQRG
jgi:hypothetical protein